MLTLRVWEQAGVSWKITAANHLDGVLVVLWSMLPAESFSSPNHPMRRWRHVWSDGTPGDGIMEPAGDWSDYDSMIYVPERLLFDRWRKPFRVRLQEAIDRLCALPDRYEKREQARAEILGRVADMAGLASLDAQA